MKQRARLLHFRGCPNVEQARKNLTEAFRRVNTKAEWAETDVQSEDCPPQWRGFPSPSILVDERDVATGDSSRTGSSACRFGGAPKVEQIANALHGRSWLASLTALPAAAIAFVPASFCPACVPALAGLLGAVGLGAYGERLLAPVTAALLLVALGGLAVQARRARDFRPLAVGALGAAVMYAGQFLLGSPIFKWSGSAVLVGASLWNVLPGFGTAGGKACATCVKRS